MKLRKRIDRNSVSISPFFNNAVRRLLRQDAVYVVHDPEYAKYRLVQYFIEEIINDLKRRIDDMVVEPKVEGRVIPMTRKIRKTFSISDTIYSVIESYAKQYGLTLSEALERVIQDAINDKICEKAIRDYEIAVLRAAMKQLEGEINAKKELEVAYRLLKDRLKELSKDFDKRRVIANLKAIYDYMDQYGKVLDEVRMNFSRELDEINDYFVRTYGVEFDLEKFANECWLKDKSIEEWLEEFEYKHRY